MAELGWMLIKTCGPPKENTEQVSSGKVIFLHMGVATKFLRRRGKPQVLAMLLPLTDRATHFGNPGF